MDHVRQREGEVAGEGAVGRGEKGPEGRDDGVAEGGGVELHLEGRDCMPGGKPRQYCLMCWRKREGVSYGRRCRLGLCCCRRWSRRPPRLLLSVFASSSRGRG